MIQCELIQLKIVTGTRFFGFDLKEGTGRFLGWTRNWVSLYFGAGRGADLLSEVEGGADGLGDFGEFGVDLWELDTFANRYIRAFPDRPGLDDLINFLFFNDSILAFDVDYLVFYMFGFLGFIF